MEDTKKDMSMLVAICINTLVSSAPNVSDLDRGRILGNFEDYSNLIKLGEILNTVHALGGYPVEPCDLM